MPEKISACIICAEDEEFIDLTIQSIVDYVDEIVLVGNPNTKTLSRISHWMPKIQFYHREWDEDFGAARQFALEKATGEWILQLDADEYLENAMQLKHSIGVLDKMNLSVSNFVYEHFIGDIGHLDATQPFHIGLHRFFKKSPTTTYYNQIHELAFDKAWAKNGKIERGASKDIKIWHLGYLKSISLIYDKYVMNQKKGAHTPEFLEQWKNAHLLGKYPVKETNLAEVPKPILQRFGMLDYKPQVNVNQISQLEPKHFMMAIRWAMYFTPQSVLDVGSGWGHYLCALSNFGIKIGGVELDENRINSMPYPQLKPLVKQGNIMKIPHEDNSFELVIANDVLEHLNEIEIGFALDELKRVSSKHILLSICFEDDPNFPLDPTHKTKKPRLWWEDKIREHGLKVKETPDYFLFKEQYVVVEK